MVKTSFSVALISLSVGGGLAWSTSQLVRSRSTATNMNAVSRRDILSSMPAAFTILAAPQIAFAADKVVEEKKENKGVEIGKTAKKPAGKGAEVGKTAAKKPADKKVESKSTAKKPADKKAESKSAAKKPADKGVEVGKTAAKKPADKKAESKPAATKTAVKAADSKTAAKKTDVKTPLPIDPSKYQGVYFDPKHPKGYRALFGSKMQLQDDPKGKVFDLPIKVQTDKKTKATKILFDFEPKGGPKDVAGILAEVGGVTTLTFPDGNVWKKDSGVIGVYKDGKTPSYTRTIRANGSGFTVDLVNGGKTVTVAAKSKQGKILFDFPGKLQDPGTLNAKDNTISFGDGNVWTKF